MRLAFGFILFLASFQAAAATIWQELRQESLLTNQTSKINRDDLCVAAAAINLAQGLARQLKRAPIRNPHAVFESLVENYPGVNDDIGMLEIAQTLRKVLVRTFPQDKFNIEAVLLDRYSEKDMTGVRSVERLTVSDLVPAPNEGKILRIDLFDGTGEYIGEHAIVAESLAGGELKFVNSFEPGVDSRAQMYANPGSTWKGYQIPTFKVVSPIPPTLKSPHAFFVRGVITVKK